MLPAITVVKEPPENNNMTKENDMSLNETNTTNLNEVGIYHNSVEQEKKKSLPWWLAVIEMNLRWSRLCPERSAKLLFTSASCQFTVTV